jgi:branched-chain amino acid transport system permease protein
VLAVWYNGQIAPGSIDLTRTIDVLVIAVIGGLYRLEGAWIGALAVTLLTNFANDYTARFNTVIGLIFIGILLLSPGGIAGIWERVVTRGSKPSLT